MPAIVLSTLNAKYIHASLGLRYLQANLGALREQSVLREFVIHDRPADIVERLLSHAPTIVGLGVYVWNVQPTLEVVRILKRVAPEVVVVLGGPEVRYEHDRQEICALADYVIAGEADHAFRVLCEAVLGGHPPPRGVQTVPPPTLANVALPYSLFSDDDLQHRVVYVEASRGCPYQCEFCLSSMDDGVRRFDTEVFLAEIDGLIARGARHFKFVDRTFNLDLRVTTRILEFFLQRVSQGVFAHFELVPDRLPDALRSLIAQFPDGALQFEVGIQTWDVETAARISRRQDYTKTEENLRYLRSATKVHLHTDLIVGLPGESLESIALGFDRLVALDPHEIQVGVLKRLRGTPIIRHDAQWQMAYSQSPPYELLQSRTLTFAQVQSLKRFARAWDMVGNSGRYRTLRALVLGLRPSAFDAFNDWAKWLHEEIGDFTGLSPERLGGLLCSFLQARGLSADQAMAAKGADDQARELARLKLKAEARALKRQVHHEVP
jgi:radical SAM superfamily enzyme YgiQ (UPF0313 family)